MSQPLDRGVLVVGTGLLGTSVGLALRRAGVEVRLRDADEAALGEAVELGAGRRAEPGDPAASLAVVAVPPEVTGSVVAALLDHGSAAYA
ncbi:MAG: prephenate dehydrogenase, partial [Acidimicrobiales bacterium]